MWSHPPLQKDSIYKSTFDVKQAIPVQPSLTMRVSNDIGSKQISIRSVTHAPAPLTVPATTKPVATPAPTTTTAAAATTTASSGGASNTFTFRSYASAKAPSNRVAAMATSAASSLLFSPATATGGASDTATAASTKAKSAAAQTHAAIHAELTKTHFELEHPVWKKTNTFSLPREHAIGVSVARGGVSNADRQKAVEQTRELARAGRALPRTVDRQQHHTLWDGGVVSRANPPRNHNPSELDTPSSHSNDEETKTAAPPAAASSSPHKRSASQTVARSSDLSDHFTSTTRASFVPVPHQRLVERQRPELTSLQAPPIQTTIGRTRLVKVKLSGNDLWRTQYAFGSAPPQFESMATVSYANPSETRTAIANDLAKRPAHIRNRLPAGAAGARSNVASTHNPITGAERAFELPPPLPSLPSLPPATATATASGTAPSHSVSAPSNVNAAGKKLQISPFEYSHRTHYGKVTGDGGLQRQLGLPLPTSGVSLYWYDSAAQKAVDAAAAARQPVSAPAPAATAQ